MMIYREARSADLANVLEVHRSAFARDEEAELVVALLSDPTAQPVLSVLAQDGDHVVGHALFSTVRLRTPAPAPVCALLAPLAVVPSYQNTGVGRGLIEHGCREAFERGTTCVFVLGDPGYYGRRGFVPAAPLGLEAPYPIQLPEAWRVRARAPDALVGMQGAVVSPRALAAEHYWRE